MSTTVTGQGVDAPRTRRPIPWLTVGLLAGVLAALDAFLIVSLDGAIGAIERSQTPFLTWVRMSVLLVPILGLAILGVLRLAHRRYGDQLRSARTVLPTAAAIVAVGTAVGIATLTVNSVIDYRLQLQQISVAHALHSTAVTGEGNTGILTHGHAGSGVDPNCIGDCVAQRQTRSTHIKGFKLVSGLLLGGNTLAAGWVIALRGGELDADRRRRRDGAVPTPTAAPAAEPVAV